MDLRSSASGDRGREGASLMRVEATPMTGLVAEHLAAVRMDLWSSMEQLMTLIKQRAEALQKESSRQFEEDLAELRKENVTLRDQLARSHIDAIESRTGGTGDTMPRQQSAVNRDRTQSAASLFEIRSSQFSTDSARDSGIGMPMHLNVSPPPAEANGPQPKGIRFATDIEVKHLEDNGNGLNDGTSSSIPMHKAGSAHKIFGASSFNSPRPGGAAPPSAAGREEPTATRASVDQTRRALPTRWSRTRKEFQKGMSNVFSEKTAEQPTERWKKKKDMARTVQKEAVFADAAAMKDRVRAALAKPEYNVADFYWDSGWCQKIARHQIFEYITLGVIAINALWIAIDVDHNDQAMLLNADPVFQFAEHSFCIFFTFEWTVRFLSFREKRKSLQDAWFCFDTALVVIMVIETWLFTLVFLIAGHGGSSGGLGNTSVLKLVRLVRLTRMARMAKLLRAVPELIILIKGIAVAARSVFFTLVLLVIIIYFFAIVLRQLTADSEIGAEFYATVPDAMSSLLLDGVLPDQAVLVRANGDSHLLLGVTVLFFILLSSLTVMNMLVGVLCEVVSVVSAVEKEQLTVNYVKQRLQAMFQAENSVDTDRNNTISKSEFENMLTNKEAAEIIQDMGVDVVGLVDFADIIFENDIELSFADFMELVLQLRGSNNCTVKDMVDLRKFVVTELSAAEARTIEALCHIMKFDTQKLHQFLVQSSDQKEDTTLEITDMTHVSHSSVPTQRFQLPPLIGAPGATSPATELPGSVGLA